VDRNVRDTVTQYRDSSLQTLNPEREKHAGRTGGVNERGGHPTNGVDSRGNWRLRCGMARFRLVLAAALAVSGCAGRGGPADSPTTPATGAVHGAIVQVGGPPGAEPGHPAGAVTVTRAGRRVAEQHVAEGGEFRFTLSPGSYRLTVKDVDGGCAPTDVTVPAGPSDQAIDLTCQRK